MKRESDCSTGYKQGVHNPIDRINMQLIYTCKYGYFCKPKICENKIKVEDQKHINNILFITSVFLNN